VKLIDFLNSDINNIEVYGAKRPKFNKESSLYFFEENMLVSLSTFDYAQNIKSFFNAVMKPHLIDFLQDNEIKAYSNDDNLSGYVYLDENTNLSYKDSLNQSLTSIALLEGESVSFQYLVFLLSSDDDEMVIFMKLRSPLKVENNTFYIKPNNYDLTISKDNIDINNYPSITLDLDLISFINYKDDFYVIDKDLYQKYFNLDSYFFRQAENLVYHNSNIISDGNLLTKSNAKFVYEHFDVFHSFINSLEDEEISKDSVQHVIDTFSLGIQYNEDGHKFILRKPQDLIDMILLSSSCLGINSITQQPYKIKRPNYMVNE